MKTPKVRPPAPDDVLNLDNDNVFTLHTTDLRVRTWLEDETEFSEDFEGVFDEAQGFVFTGDGKPAYIVIKITKEEGPDA